MEMELKMQEALDLNTQLRRMVLEAEAAQASQAMARPSRAPSRSLGGAHTTSAMGARRPKAAARLPGSEGRAGVGGWGGQTHTIGRATQINHDNAILAEKLTRIAVGRDRAGAVGPLQARVTPVKSSATVNRIRKDDKIAKENAAMQKRLMAVKASKSNSIYTISAHAEKHDRYRRNVARMAPPQTISSQVTLRQPSAPIMRGPPRGRW